MMLRRATWLAVAAVLGAGVMVAQTAAGGSALDAPELDRRPHGRVDLRAAQASTCDAYGADTFSRLVPPGDSWGEPDVGAGPWEASFGGSKLGLWSVANGVAKAQTTNRASAGQRIRSTRDVDVRVRFALSALARRGRVSTGLFARFRSLGGPDGPYVRMRVTHDDDRRFRLSLARVAGDVTTHTREVDAGPAKARRWYWMRFQAVGATIRGKLWSVRAPEPRWQVAMRHPAIAQMPETDVGIRNTYATSAVLPLILFDDFEVTAPARSGCR